MIHHQAHASSRAKLIFAVQNVEATFKRIEQMGLLLLRRPWGDKEAVDPEGNVFAVSTAP